MICGAVGSNNNMDTPLGANGGVECKHHHIQTYRLEDGSPVIWACFDCGRKFVPLALPTPDDAFGALQEKLRDEYRSGLDSPVDNSCYE
jgi:hypothetical protein